MEKKVKIIVATHKKYRMPDSDLYLPLQVGAEGKEDIGFQKDNTGDNISLKNPYFCELTGLYWAWKNLESDYIGLVHYRRHFTTKRKIPKNQDEKFSIILKPEELEEKLKKADIILPKKRNYYIETVYLHYKHTLYVEPLDETGKIIQEKYPEYYKEFEEQKQYFSMHAFNMFIMKKEYLDEYCQWLFDILFELEKKIDVTQYDAFHARFFGRISEVLLDVWLRTKRYYYSELKVMDIENINWFKKGASFLKAKFLGKKYGKSF